MLCAIITPTRVYTICLKCIMIQRLMDEMRNMKPGEYRLIYRSR